MGLPWFRPKVERLSLRGDAKGLVQALIDSHQLREDCVSALGSLGERSLGPLLAVLGDDIDDPLEEDDLRSVGEYLALAIALVGQPAVMPLIDLLSSDSTTARRRGMGALALIQDRRAIAPLLEAVRHEKHSYTRAEAIRALGDVAGTECLDVVIAVSTDPYAWVRRQAASTLGNLRDDRALSPLRSLADATNAWDPSDPIGDMQFGAASPGDAAMRTFHRARLQCATAGSLAMLGDDVALRWLLERIQGAAGRGYQDWAAEELGRVGGAEATQALDRALRAPGSGVLKAAVRALAETRDPSGTQLLEEALGTANKKDGKVISRGLRWRKLLQSARPAGGAPASLPPYQ